jgi:phage terminase Nu1 subunit (DNA packaging protein)
MATVAECSEHCFVSVTRLRDLIAAGKITHAANGQYDFTTVRREYIKYLQESAAGRGDGVGGVALSTQRARLASAQADRAVRRNQIESGGYVRLETFAKIVDETFLIVRERLLNLPGECSDAVSALSALDRGVVHTILHDKVYEALTELSDTDYMKNAKARARRQTAHAREAPDHAADAAPLETAK